MHKFFIICSGFQARKVIKKKRSFTEQKERKFITADTAHLLNRVGVLVTDCMLFNCAMCVFACVWVFVCIKCACTS